MRWSRAVVGAVALVVVGGGSAAAATAIGHSTKSDVSTLLKNEQAVVAVLKSYKHDASWDKKLASAEAAQASAEAALNTNLSSTTTTLPEPSHTVTSASPGASRAVPKVTGEQLDQAEAALLADDLGYKVFGGGVFGIVVASDWTVCSQSPSPGATAAAVDLTVARSCS